MPVHDWSHIRAGKFHHFHNSWIYRLSDKLNGGVLPPGFYAAGEQVAGDIEPDVLTLQQSPEPDRNTDWHSADGVVAIQEHPPQVAVTQEAEQSLYLRKQDRLAIRSSDDDRIVSLVEIVSRSNKDSRRRFDQFLQKVATALESSIHVLVIDLHPPGTFDPGGIHGAVWEYLFGICPHAPDDRPLSLVSYRAEPVPTAYVEPVVLGGILPDMPLFLDAEWYVNVPLEETYMETWRGIPEPWKAALLTG